MAPFLNRGCEKTPSSSFRMRCAFPWWVMTSRTTRGLLGTIGFTRVWTLPRTLIFNSGFLSMVELRIMKYHKTSTYTKCWSSVQDFVFKERMFKSGCYAMWKVLYDTTAQFEKLRKSVESLILQSKLWFQIIKKTPLDRTHDTLTFFEFCNALSGNEVS